MTPRQHRRTSLARDTTQRNVMERWGTCLKPQSSLYSPSPPPSIPYPLWHQTLKSPKLSPNTHSFHSPFSSDTFLQSLPIRSFPSPSLTRYPSYSNFSQSRLLLPSPIPSVPYHLQCSYFLSQSIPLLLPTSFTTTLLPTPPF